MKMLRASKFWYTKGGTEGSVVGIVFDEFNKVKGRPPIVAKRIPIGYTEEETIVMLKNLGYSIERITKLEDIG